MAADTPLHEGLVVASHGRHAVVEALDGSRRICHPRGKKNQALVGDAILWQAPPAGQGEEGTIESILPRRNVFYRQDDIRTKAFAANIDRVLVWLAAEPDSSPQLRGDAPNERLAFASRCAAFACARVGARSSPRLDEIEPE